MSDGFAHETSKSCEWYTPRWIFKELGLEFDLDPAHPEKRLEWVPAKDVYTKADDGLNKPWHGRVWLNPPYGRETPKWLDKMAKHNNGVALIFARTDTAWFHKYAGTASGILFLRGRVDFVNAEHKARGNAGCGSMLLSWGYDNDEALCNMNEQGMLWLRGAY